MDGAAKGLEHYLVIILVRGGRGEQLVGKPSI